MPTDDGEWSFCQSWSGPSTQEVLHNYKKRASKSVSNLKNQFENFATPSANVFENSEGSIKSYKLLQFEKCAEKTRLDRNIIPKIVTSSIKSIRMQFEHRSLNKKEDSAELKLSRNTPSKCSSIPNLLAKFDPSRSHSYLETEVERQKEIKEEMKKDQREKDIERECRRSEADREIQRKRLEKEKIHEELQRSICKEKQGIAIIEEVQSISNCRPLNPDEMQIFMGMTTSETFMRTQSLRVKPERQSRMKRSNSMSEKSSPILIPKKPRTSMGPVKSVPCNCRQLRPEELKFFSGDMTSSKDCNYSCS